MWNELLEHQSHRPWPVPEMPFAFTMTWSDLLFAHWPLPFELIRPLVPAALELETFDGMAWIGVVPFRMTNAGPRYANHLPGVSRFLELNVRTNVSVDGKPGVLFFSLDAASWQAVKAARTLAHLPYPHASMSLRDGQSLDCTCVRVDKRLGPGEFQARYRPIGSVFHANPGDFEHWLAERYCLYAIDNRGHVYRSDIHHRPWPPQPAEAEISANTIVDAHGFELPKNESLLHFSRRLHVVARRPVRVR